MGCDGFWLVVNLRVNLVVNDGCERIDISGKDVFVVNIVCWFKFVLVVLVILFFL